MRQLIDTIVMLNKEISIKIPEVNRGGCGVFALKMVKELKKLGYNPNIVILTNWMEDYGDKKDTLNNLLNKIPVGSLEKKDTSFSHCCVEIGGLYFDAHYVGLDFLRKWEDYEVNINNTYTIEEMEVALKVGGWNGAYNRRKRNPTLNSIIKKSISKNFSYAQ